MITSIVPFNHLDIEVPQHVQLTLGNLIAAKTQFYSTSYMHIKLHAVIRIIESLCMTVVILTVVCNDLWLNN